MQGKKNLIYRNSFGQEAVFDNRTLFLEAIDMVGTPIAHSTETLAFADGQQTTAHQLGAKVIPCSLAIKCVKNVEWLKRRLAQVFSDPKGGTMTVLTEYSRYEIDCYPLNVPTFAVAENDGVYRFDVDFVADYPYWREGDIKEYTFGSVGITISSDCTYALPLMITLPAAESPVFFYNNGTGIWVKAHENPLRINTKNYEVWERITGVWTKGGNRFLDPSMSMDNVNIVYGTNALQSAEGVSFSFYNLSIGEV